MRLLFPGTLSGAGRQETNGDTAVPGRNRRSLDKGSLEKTHSMTPGGGKAQAHGGWSRKQKQLEHTKRSWGPKALGYHQAGRICGQNSEVKRSGSGHVPWGHPEGSVDSGRHESAEQMRGSRRPLKTQPMPSPPTPSHILRYTRSTGPRGIGSGLSVPRPASAPPKLVPSWPGCWWLSGRAGGRSNTPPGPGLAHQENITWHWNEVISSSRCEEMGIYVAVGMVFIFPNFQITFD